MIWPPFPNTPAIFSWESQLNVERILSERLYQLDTIYAFHADREQARVLAGRGGSLVNRYYQGTLSLSLNKVLDESFLGVFLSPRWLRGELRQWYDHFQKERRKICEENQKDIKEKIKPIRLYQGTLEEIAAHLGKKLEIVDTGDAQTFLKSHGDFWLRVEAYQLGADAIIHYQPGSAMGTPVRVKK